MQLKSWESPRRQGRNRKGKGGSARARQLRKRQQKLRQQLKGGDNSKNNSKERGGSTSYLPVLLLGIQATKGKGENMI